jgi:hypothetical protein
MQHNGIEYVFQVTLLLCYTAVTGTLVILGVYIEYQSILLSGSEPSAGLWLSAVGLATFGFAYLVFDHKLLPLTRSLWF